MSYRGKIAPAAVLSFACIIFALCAGCIHGHQSGSDILVVTTGSLPNGNVGVAYQAVLTATRKNGPYDFTWSLDQGSSPLPDGLSLSASGAITGVPTKGGTFSFVVKVSDASRTPPETATMPLSITVMAGSGIVIGTSPSPLPTASVGFAYTASMTASGGVPPYNWSLDTGSPSLPPGLSLSSGGHFTGTPTQSGSFSFVVRAVDSTLPVPRVSTSPVTMNVSTPGQVIITTAALPNGKAGQAYSYLISAAGGTTPYAWVVSSGTLPSGFVLDSTTGEVTGLTQESGLWSFTVMVTDATPDSPGEYVKDLTLQIQPASLLAISTPSPLPTWQADIAYAEVLNATGGTEPYEFDVSAGDLPPGLDLSSSGILSGVPTTPGRYEFVITVTDNTSPAPLEAVKGFSLTIESPGSITIQQETLPDAVQSHSYEAVLSAVGGGTTYAWSIASGSLPPGISLAADGVISGTPLDYGTWAFVVEVTDGSLTNTKSLSLKVRPELVISTEILPDALLDGAYSFSLLATGGTAPYLWTIDTGSSPLPTNLSLSTGGHITGSATTVGQYSFAIKVTDSSAPTLAATKAFTMGVGELVITTTALPNATWGEIGYNAIIKVEYVGGAPPPYNWAWAKKSGSGSFPPSGVTPFNIALYDPASGYAEISGDVGLLSGTVTYTFTVTVSESNYSWYDEQELSITVSAP